MNATALKPTLLQPLHVDPAIEEALHCTAARTQRSSANRRATVVRAHWQGAHGDVPERREYLGDVHG